MNLATLHQFWFEDISLTDAYYEKKVSQWFFGKGSEFDKKCSDNFSSWVDFAHTFDSQKLTTPEYIGLILLCDQIPRNSFRDNPKAWASDAFARKLSLEAINTSLEDKLSLPEKMFLYMPLEHAEDPQMQELSVEKFEKLHNEAPLAVKKWTELALHKALEHQETIKRYGKFPNRIR